MKNILIVILIFPFSSTALTQSKWDFSTDSLFVVWGANNYSGKQDCSAKAKMTSNDSSVIIEVEVTDDKLIFNNNPLYSDHIEIWFALQNAFKGNSEDDYYEPRNVTSYLYGNTSYVYLYKGKPDIEAFKKEVQSPQIQTHVSDGYLNYSELEPDDDWLKADIDKYLTEARSASLKKTNTFFGLVHLGVLPKIPKAIMYDKEAFEVLQKQAGVAVPDYSKFVKVETQITTNGYKAKIVIPPQGLGFASKTGIKNALILINVVDTDVPGKQETLLSTSQSQKWGDPSTFNQINFNTTVRVPIFPRFALFGTSDRSDNIYSELRDLLSDVFMYTAAGWTPIDRQCEQFNEYNQPTRYWLPNIQKTRFVKGNLDHNENKLGRNTLGYLNTSKGKYLIVNGKAQYSMEGVLNTFLLPDGSVGLITTEYDITGTYTKSMESKLCLITNDKNILLAEFTDFSPEARMRFTDSIIVTAKEWDRNHIDWWSYDDKNGDWSKLFKLDEKGGFIIFDLGNKQRVKIWWDEHGGNIKYKKL